MIVIDHVAKKFTGNAGATLDDLSLTIEPGSFFTLFGPSGCGKSTLLRCIAGLETPDAGEIQIGGVTVFSAKSGVFVPPNKRRIGMVFQSYAIWPHMTVFDNVAFPLAVQKHPETKQRTRAVLDMVGLGKLENRNASRLSGGQQQRVALARAVVADPAVLLLDEPLSNLDAALRDQMQAELMALQKRLNMTTVYVTHDQGEALSMSDRIAVMNEGRFVEIGAPRALYDAPQSAFTARMIGAANLIAASAQPGDNGQTRLTTPFGSLLSSERGSGDVQLFIRPEKIRIEDKPAPGMINLIACRVASRRFAGDRTEFDLVAGESQSLRCRASSGVGHGDTVHIAVDPSDVHILKPA